MKLKTQKNVTFSLDFFKDYPLENEEHLPNYKCQNIREDM